MQQNLMKKIKWDNIYVLTWILIVLALCIFTLQTKADFEPLSKMVKNNRVNSNLLGLSEPLPAIDIFNQANARVKNVEGENGGAKAKDIEPPKPKVIVRTYRILDGQQWWRDPTNGLYWRYLREGETEEDVDGLHQQVSEPRMNRNESYTSPAICVGGG